MFWINLRAKWSLYHITCSYASSSSSFFVLPGLFLWDVLATEDLGEDVKMMSCSCHSRTQLPARRKSGGHIRPALSQISKLIRPAATNILCQHNGPLSAFYDEDEFFAIAIGARAPRYGNFPRSPEKIQPWKSSSSFPAVAGLAGLRLGVNIWYCRQWHLMKLKREARVDMLEITSLTWLRSPGRLIWIEYCILETRP